MSHVDQLLTKLKAAAYEKGVPTMAKEAKMSDDKLRRLLSDEPPAYIESLRALERIATKA